MAGDSIKVEYKIKEITTELNEQHDTIILTELVEFCGQNDLLEYKVSVDTLREALNFYFEYKDRKKGKWERQVFGNYHGNYYCSICNEQSIEAGNFCPHCGAEMEVAKNATTTEEAENEL